MTNKKGEKRGSQWRQVALPAEHGSWGLVLEPIALGLLSAYSWQGLYLGLGAFFAFLCFQPLRIAWRGARRGVAGPRQHKARRFALLYGLLTATFLLLAWISGDRQPFWLLLAASPLALIYLRYDLDGPSRAWQAEVSGSLAFASMAAAIALAGGAQEAHALALWGLIALRGLVSVAYIRARLRLEKGNAAQIRGVLAMHVLAALLVLGMALAGWLPNLAAWAMLILLLRAALGLSAWRWESRVRTIGFMELAYGALLVLMVGLGG